MTLYWVELQLLLHGIVNPFPQILPIQLVTSDILRPVPEIFHFVARTFLEVFPPQQRKKCKHTRSTRISLLVQSILKYAAWLTHYNQRPIDAVKIWPQRGPGLGPTRFALDKSSRRSVAKTVTIPPTERMYRLNGNLQARFITNLGMPQFKCHWTISACSKGSGGPSRVGRNKQELWRSQKSLFMAIWQCLWHVGRWKLLNGCNLHIGIIFWLFKCTLVVRVIKTYDSLTFC